MDMLKVNIFKPFNSEARLLYIQYNGNTTTIGIIHIRYMFKKEYKIEKREPNLLQAIHREKQLTKPRD